MAVQQVSPDRSQSSEISSMEKSPYDVEKAVSSSAEETVEATGFSENAELK
jgi:hypothetical protein